MDLDVPALVAQVMPYVSAAVGAYGAGVLTKAQDAAADSTVGFGKRLLSRLVGQHEAAGSIEGAVVDLADDPTDEDRVAALRLQIRKALAADNELATDLAAMLRQAPQNFTASGDRSITAQVISGVAVTGDNARIWR
ncbi:MULTISPECIES: hypothetical protein [unclassified Micromonospora]|uniref:hypothetical protein n=1 Tax=unclassified Micromonospora TaxID=2617518 RepID=UPI001B37A970|nr:MULTISPECIES: hypothetical protein [unclassified Micromonospora]MBQ1044409.1 hypothetical protein [Micromonospora sp. C72]MBQ1056914.1 hypothetical protein [Micromonospora sp. C32]